MLIDYERLYKRFASTGYITSFYIFPGVVQVNPYNSSKTCNKELCQVLDQFPSLTMVIEV